MRKFTGIGLVETLVSLSISSLFMLILVHQYGAFYRHYRIIEQAFESSMDEQLVIALIRNSIRQAGFTPCMGIERLKTLDTRLMKHNLKAIKIHPHSGFTVNRMSSEYSEVLDQVSSEHLRMTNTLSLSPQKFVVVADCYHAEVHSIQSITQTRAGAELRLDRPLQFQLIPPIYIGEWLEETFFVKEGKMALYYSQNHTDLLLNTIETLSATLLFEHGRRLVKILLHFHAASPSVAGKSEGKFIEFVTALRVP